MGARTKVIITEYVCDWCQRVEERSSDYAPYMTPSTWRQLPKLGPVSANCIDQDHEILCEGCIAHYEHAVASAKKLVQSIA